MNFTPGMSREEMLRKLIEETLLKSLNRSATLKYCYGSHYNAPELTWLPHQPNKKYKRGSENELGLFEYVRSRVTPGISLGLFEMSITPLLANKFHSVNVTKLMQDYDNLNFPRKFYYLATATWFIHWCTSFALQYLNYLHYKHLKFNRVIPVKQLAYGQLEFEGTPHEKDCTEYIQFLNGYIESIGICTKIEYLLPIGTSECITKSIEFLLEPCILIQLPWDNTLFHQWLVAALVEISMFEKFTLELRTWSVAEDVKTVTEELLRLIKNLKNRIYLGFAIMYQQIHKYPQVDSNHPVWILDEVVLPSLEALEFINNPSKGHSILKSIKKLSWPETGTLTGVYVNPGSYEVHPQLQAIFQDMFYSYIFWLDFPLGPLNISRDHSKIDIQNIIQEIKTEVPLHNGYISSEEQLVREFLLEDLKKYEMAPQGRVNYALAMIQENIIDNGRLPQESWEKIKNTYKNCIKNEDFSNTLFTKSPETLSFMQKCVSRCLLYKRIHQCLLGSEEEESILTRVVIIGLETADREQILKLTDILSKEINIKPVDINVKKYTAAPMEVSAMLKCMSEVGEKDRDWLWSQFPAQWRQPVTVTQPDINMDMGVDKIVKTCEERIGRIIVNAAQTCFDVYQKGGAIFPQWKVVQYIMPCFVAHFISDYKSLYPNKREHRNVLSNFAQFLHEMLKYYEKLFLVWQSECKSRKQLTSAKNIKLNSKLADDIGQIYVDIKNEMKCSDLFLIPYLCTELPSDLNVHKFEMFKHPSMYWHSKADEPIEVKHYPILHYLKSWDENALSIIQDINIVAFNVFKTPFYQSLEYQSGLKDMYIAITAISFIEHVYSKLMYNLNDTPLTNLFSVGNTIADFEDMKEKTLAWRYKFYFAVVKYTTPKEKRILIKLMDKGKTIILKNYKIFKDMKKKIGPKTMPSLQGLPNDPPTIKISVKKFFNENFSELENMIPLFAVPGKEPSQSKAKKCGPDVRSKIQSKGIQCRNCSNKEKKQGMFLKCESCINDKYPDVNLFCSKECKDIWWEKQHKEEHLNFILGIGDHVPAK